MSNKPLKLREFLQKMKEFGVVAMSRRGKGSEIVLVKPVKPGSQQGPQFPIKNHGDSTEIHGPVIKAALRRFGISEDKFWQ